MITDILIAGGAAGIGALIGFLLTKREYSSKYQLYTTKAKAKAKAIELEAEKKLQGAGIKAKEAELEAKKKYEEKLSKLDERQKAIKAELDEINASNKKILKKEEEIKSLVLESQNLKKEYEKKLKEVLVTLEKSAGLTSQEAKEIVLKKVEENSRDEIAHIVRKYEEEAKKEGRNKAYYIIAQATTRFAGEFAGERLINVVSIKDDEVKGKIIGKEGRNIKALEMLLGVDIIIDDTPNTIIVSSFNIYRRAVATKVIQTLVEDGRIQPARIEEVHKKTEEEFENQLLEEGENIVMDLGLKRMHPEITKLIGKLKFRASYGQNALAHSLEVAHLAGIIAAECGGDEVLAKRAGLLHDIGKSLTHDFSGSHVDLGGDLCKRYKEDPVVINAIYAHHGHEEAFSVESAAVCTADALSAARPGARREVLESFLKRVQDIENIATSKQGVRQAYAINAGREVRVILNAKLVNDDEGVLLAKEIAKEIEENVQYPGDVKVNVIRESRTTEYAK
jgi:ribonuclease Y